MRLNKMAFSGVNVIVGIVIVLVFFIIAYYILTGIIAPGLNYQVNLYTCKFSAMLSSTVKIAGFQFFGLKCPTQKIKIDGFDQEEIKKTIADSMYDCWWKFGEGEWNLLSDYKKGDICVICSKINFEGSDFKNEVKLSGLYKYLKDHKKTADSKWTYLQYFYSPRSKISFPDIKETPYVFSEEIPYSVVYRITKESGWEKIIVYSVEFGAGGLVLGTLIPIPGIGTVTGGILGVVGGAIYGATRSDVYRPILFFIPYNEIVNSCKSLE